MTRQVVERDVRHTQPLPFPICFTSLTIVVALARLDLDEHRRGAVARDDVNLAAAPPIAPREYHIPTTLQFAARQFLAVLAENLPRACHRGRRSNSSASYRTVRLKADTTYLADTTYRDGPPEGGHYVRRGVRSTSV